MEWVEGNGGGDLANNKIMKGGPILSGIYNSFSLPLLMTCKQPFPTKERVLLSFQ